MKFQRLAGIGWKSKSYQIKFMRPPLCFFSKRQTRRI
ncbi:hypothetical protein LINPERHAP1_LOCUS34681 [Linum perenne]